MKLPSLTVGMFQCLQCDVWGNLSKQVRAQGNGSFNTEKPCIQKKLDLLRFILRSEESRMTVQQFDMLNEAGARPFTQLLCSALPSIWEEAIINRFKLEGDQIIFDSASNPQHPSFSGILRAFAATFPPKAMERKVLEHHAHARTLPASGDLRSSHAEWNKVLESMAIADKVNLEALLINASSKSINNDESDETKTLDSSRLFEKNSVVQNSNKRDLLPKRAPMNPTEQTEKAPFIITKKVGFKLDSGKQPPTGPKQTTTASVHSLPRKRSREIARKLASSGRLSLLFHVQHYILKQVQQRLETCVFNFLNTQMPDFLAHYGWSSPLSLELNVCLNTLPEYYPEALKASGIDLKVWQRLKSVVCSIRHGAVHRQPVDDDQLITQLSCATDFVKTCLHDTDLALLLTRLRLLVSEKDQQLATEIVVLRRQLNRKKADIMEEGEIVEVGDDPSQVMKGYPPTELSRINREGHEAIDDLQMVISLELIEEARLLFQE